jgi:hypothetical protein
MRSFARKWLPCLALALPACNSDPQATDAPDMADVGPLATGLTYDDPTCTGWRLVKDASSTPAKIVLNLVGPKGLMSRGVAFNLKAPEGVHFVVFEETNWALRDTGVYELMNLVPRTPNPVEPMLLLGAVKPGNLLTAGLFQKDRRADAKDSGQPLCQIALELSKSATPHAGEDLKLEILKSAYMAEDIGEFSPNPTAEMRAKAHLVPATIAVGSLHAQ